MWGPLVLGAHGYVATDDRKLYCLGTAAQPQWVATLESSSVVGGCAIDAQHIALGQRIGSGVDPGQRDGPIPGWTNRRALAARRWTVLDWPAIGCGHQGRLRVGHT